MHTSDLSAWTHSHRYETGIERKAERRTRAVVLLTLVMMVAEIGVGIATNSMALLADGIHMSTHAVALGIAVFAYAHARKHADDPRYTFGTGKVGSLAAFASAIILAMVGALMLWESGARLLAPQTIAFDQALVVAAIGLVVNLVSAVMLSGGSLFGGDEHDHAGHEHGPHGHAHSHHRDHNLRAAYLHVVADALTSVLAIVALLFGKYAGWWWLDPVMGVVGALIIASWARTMIAQSGGVLLDRSEDRALESEVRRRIEADADNRVSDLHVWRIGQGHWAAIVSLVTRDPRPTGHYRKLLEPMHALSHVTVEVHACA